MVSINKAIEESLSDANARGLTSAPLWQRIIPVVGAYSRQELASAELASLMEIRENELAQQAIDLIMRHATFLEAFQTYCRKREALKELFPTTVQHDNGVLTTLLTGEDVGKLTPYSVELESLIKLVRDEVPELRSLAERVTFKIGPAVRAKLDTKDFPLMVPKDDPRTEASS